MGVKEGEKMTLSFYNLLKTVVTILMGVIAFFLSLRIVFLFFSVNPATPFVGWILGVGESLSSPFGGIAPNISIATGVLDVVSIIALIVYMLAGYLIQAILRGLAQPEILKEEEYGTTRYHDIDREEETEYPRRYRKRRVRK